MKKFLIVITLNFALCTFSCFCFAQNKNVDSLLRLIKIDKQDTSKVIHSNELCLNYINIGLYDTALFYGNEALRLAIVIANGSKQSSVKQTAKKGMAGSYSRIGIIYDDKGDYPKALDNYFRALQINEELNNQRGIYSQFNNIGLVYHKQSDYPQALNYYFKALKILKEQGKKNEIIASIFGNIGNVYSDFADYPKALDYYFKALKIFEEYGDKNSMTIDLGNIGGVYNNQINYPKALVYYFKSLRMAEEIGDKATIANNFCNIGALYSKTGKFKEAELYLKKAIAIDDSIGVLDYLSRSEGYLSQLYDTTRRYNLALIHYKKAIALKDTIFSQENKKQLVQKEMNYEFEKKEAQTKAENDKQQAVAEEKNRRQKVITGLVGAGLLLVLVFAGFVFRSLRITRKQKQIIEIKNRETEHQKKIIEEKNKDITDSINYAERIQRALLASKKMLNENLTDYFILFKPKDIVSGDFYWAAELSNNNFVLVTADSTGHGVPGAIMSIVNIAALDKAVTQGITSPDLLLNETRRLVIENLKNDGSIAGGKDGMDASLLSFDFKNNILYCAAANNPVWIIRGGELIEIKADRMPVGKHDKDILPFTLHKINLQKNDVVYTLTDGFADQFGGPDEKKFKYKPLQELLLSISTEPMEIQKQKLNDVFDNWKGSLEQVDDVCLIGIRV